MADSSDSLSVQLLDKSDVGLILSSLVFREPDCHESVHFFREKIQEVRETVLQLGFVLLLGVPSY